MTLNGTVALILCYFTEFGSFWADYVKVVEDIDLYCLRKSVAQRI